MMSLAKNERFTDIKPSSLSPGIPKCQHFGTCPGCQWQDIDYETQLKTKTDAVIGVLADIGVTKRGLVTDCLASPDIYGYRNCLDLAAIQDDTGKVRVGIHGATACQPNISPIEVCELIPARVAKMPGSIGGALGYLFGANRDLPVERVRIRTSRHRNHLDISLWTGPLAFPRHIAAKTLVSATKASSVTRVIFSECESSSVQRIARVEHLAGRSSWVERIGGVSFYVTPASPFPHNTAVAEMMLEKAKEITDISQSDRLLELNPGAMAFSIPMSFSAGESIVVESRRFALTDITRSAEAAGAPVEIVPGDIEHSLEPAGDFDVVIAHLSGRTPSAQAWARIMGTRPGSLLYRTHGLSHLSKDIELVTRFGYTLRKVIPFDVSPHSPDLETLALFQRM